MYLSDLNMLVIVGGRERTRVDFEQLRQRTGFQLARATPLAVPDAFSVLEAVPTGVRLRHRAIDEPDPTASVRDYP
jgi:hypothetical protein